MSEGHYIAEHDGFGILGTTWHLNRGATALMEIFAGTAQASWNPGAIKEMKDFRMNSCHFAEIVRAVERDMHLTRYEDFGFLTRFQIE